MTLMMTFVKFFCDDVILTEGTLLELRGKWSTWGLALRGGLLVV